MKDIVYTRKYNDQKGQERKEYITVGYMFEKEGRTSILMKPYINLAALTNEKGEVWLGVYDHKPKTQTANTTKTELTHKEVLPEPTVDAVSQVINDGKAYAEKWAQMAKGNPGEEDDSVPF